MAPEVEDVTLGEEDFGTSWNGWSISAYGERWWKEGETDFWVTFTRSFGDTTRGGGGCLVRRVPNSSCTSDSQCAFYPWSGDGYGYCVRNVCYAPAGGQSTPCALGLNHTPGTTLFKAVFFPKADTDMNNLNYSHYTLTCMTKTAGPNTACGGTNTSAYMRDVFFIDRSS